MHWKCNIVNTIFDSNDEICSDRLIKTDRNDGRNDGRKAITGTIWKVFKPAMFEPTVAPKMHALINELMTCIANTHLPQKRQHKVHSGIGFGTKLNIGMPAWNAGASTGTPSNQSLNSRLGTYDAWSSLQSKPPGQPRSCHLT